MAQCSDITCNKQHCYNPACRRHITYPPYFCSGQCRDAYNTPADITEGKRRLTIPEIQQKILAMKRRPTLI